MISRRGFTLLTLAATAVPRVLRAQSASKAWRVGYLSMSSPGGDRHLVAALRQGLREQGYVEGENLVLEVRHALNRPEKAAELGAELAKAGVAVIVIYGSPAIRAVEKTRLPIVMTVHADPVGSGLAASLARPAGTITGLMDGHADIAPKRLQILKETVPSVARVAAMFNQRTPHGSGS